MSATAPESQGSPPEGYPLHAYAIEARPRPAEEPVFVRRSGVQSRIPDLHPLRSAAELHALTVAGVCPADRLEVVRLRLEWDPEPPTVDQGEEVDR